MSYKLIALQMLSTMLEVMGRFLLGEGPAMDIFLVKSLFDTTIHPSVLLSSGLMVWWSWVFTPWHSRESIKAMIFPCEGRSASG